MDAVQLLNSTAVSVNLTETETPIIIGEGSGSQITLVLDDGVMIGGTGGGGSSNYRFIQSSAQPTWVIPHNLGRRPAVTILDSDGRQIVAEVVHLDTSTVSINFSVPVLGSAELN